MRKKIKIKISDDSKYVIRRLNRKNIDIYDIEYRSNGNVYTVNLDDLDRIGFENVDIVSYKGIDSLIFKIKRHKHFILGCMLSILVMFFLSNCIFKIEVIHGDKEIRDLVREELKNNNVHEFMIKKSFDELQIVKENIKNKYPENIEWLEIIDDGMKYTVRVEERIITKEEEKPDYCDIISTKDAMVLSINSNSGQNRVDLTDYVKKGTVLISGAVYFNEEIKSYTCAEGEVYGNTWYTVNASVPLDYIDKKYTGKKSKNIAFEYGSKLTEIFKVHLDKYDTVKEKIFSIGNFTLYKETHKEYVSKNSKYEVEEAYLKALEIGREKLLIGLDKSATILSEKVLQRNVYDSIIEVEIFYSVKELISEKTVLEIPKEEEGVKENEST